MNAADEAECKLLSDLVQEHFGLSFAGVRRDILASRVRPRLAALRLGNLLDYYHYLRSHPRRDTELVLGGNFVRVLTETWPASSWSPVPPRELQRDPFCPVPQPLLDSVGKALVS